MFPAQKDLPIVLQEIEKEAVNFWCLWGERRRCSRGVTDDD